MSGAVLEKDKTPYEAVTAEHISLKVKSLQDGHEVFYRMKRTTKLKKLMNAYCEQQAMDMDSIRFLFDGKMLSGEQTPDKLELKDGDEIDAMFHQNGGYTMNNILKHMRSKKSILRSMERHESSGSSEQHHVPEPEIHAPDEVEIFREDIPQDSPQQQDPPQQHSWDGGILLIDSQGQITRRRGTTKCQDIHDLPPGTRVYIKVNTDGQPCNIPESTLLASYIGIVAKDCVLAPISFSDWRNTKMEPFKRRMVEKIEVKFSYPPHIRPWIRQSLAIKWRGHKTSLKAKYWDGRPLQKVIRNVPLGVDPVQWATLVTRWDEPRDKERAVQNTINAQKQKCPHTMGRISLVRRQQDESMSDRLLLWKMNRLHKDGSWATKDAKQKWDLACEMLAQSNLTPEDGDREENERVFMHVMGPEHPGRVRCKGLGVTPSRFYPQSSTSTTGASYFSADSLEKVDRLQTEVGELKITMGKMNDKLSHLISLITKKKKKERNRSPSSSSDEEDDDSGES